MFETIMTIFFSFVAGGVVALWLHNYHYTPSHLEKTLKEEKDFNEQLVEDFSQESNSGEDARVQVEYLKKELEEATDSFYKMKVLAVASPRLTCKEFEEALNDIKHPKW